MAFEDQEDETTAVKAPSEFTVGTKWKAFKEGAIAFFNSQKGRGQIPLAYIIREHAVPDPNALYDNKNQCIIALPHCKVFNMMKTMGKFSIISSHGPLRDQLGRGCINT